MSDDEESKKKTVYLKAWVSVPKNQERPLTHNDATEELEEESEQEESEEQSTRNSMEDETEQPENPSKTSILVDFYRKTWKIILLLTGSFILFLVGLFLILFLVILKPVSTTTTVTSTSSPTTVSSTQMLSTTVTSFRTTTITTREVPVTTLRSSTIEQTTQSTTVPVTTTTTEGEMTTETTRTPITTMTTVSRIPAPVPTINANTICTNNFTLANNKCLKLVTDALNQADANQKCLELAPGAVLVSIKSEDENQDVANFLKNQDLKKAWIGLQCSGDEDSSCAWDYGRGSVDSYSNFVKGYPNIDFGRCIYFFAPENKWASGDCQMDQMGFVCELPTTRPDYCEYNYNNNCYFRIDRYLNFADGEKECDLLCAHSVSIHSTLENLYVSLIKSIGTPTFLGGMSPSNGVVLWTDRSSRTYTNFANVDKSISCLHVYSNTLTWYTSDCNQQSFAICKRPVGIAC